LLFKKAKIAKGAILPNLANETKTIGKQKHRSK